MKPGLIFVHGIEYRLQMGKQSWEKKEQEQNERFLLVCCWFLGSVQFNIQGNKLLCHHPHQNMQWQQQHQHQQQRL